MIMAGVVVYIAWYTKAIVMTEEKGFFSVINIQ